MHLWGYIANTVAVVVGSSLGLLIGRFISEPVQRIILSALGLATMLIGIQMAMETRHLLLVIGSLLAGGIIGQLTGIEEWLERIGERLRLRFEHRPAAGADSSGASTFVLGFVSASILFCAGPMTIVGSLQDGFARQADLIYIKSLMDGVAAIALTASLGLGVIFSALTVFVVQGLLTYAGLVLGGSLGKPVLDEISATGGALILGIGFNLLGFARIKVGNLIPAIVVAGLLAWLLK